MSKEAAMALVSPPVPLEQSPGLVPSQPKELESTRFAHLAKKEAEIVKTREELKREREAFTSERDKLKEAADRVAKFDDLKAKDPIAALKFAGFSETDIFNFLAAAEDKSTPEERATKAAQAEIKKFQDEQAQEKKTETEKRNTAVLNEFKQDIARHISSDKDKYEYCNFYGSVAEDLIYSTVEAVLAKSNEIIGVDEAAQMVEEYYETMDQEMNSLKKRKPKDIPPPVEPIVKPEVIAKPKTLSNNVTASIASTIKRRETPSEKRERLINALRNGVTP